MRMVGMSFYLVYLFLAGCTGTKTASSTSGSARYSEDLSMLRPQVEATQDTVIIETPDQVQEKKIVEPRIAVNAQINAVLDSINKLNLNRKFVEGYTIQVYSGRREEAINTRKELTTLMPDLESEVQFTEPIFRVKAGKYYYLMDAQSDFTTIKKYFPAAIIIPEKILL